MAGGQFQSTKEMNGEARKNLIMDAVVPKILCPVEIDDHLVLKAFAALRTLEIDTKTDY
jgi:hypothetical protein